MSGILILAFLTLALLGMPLAIAFGGATLIGLLISGVDMSVFATRMASSVNSFPLMAIPLFMLTGELMIAGGIMERLVNLARVVVGRIRGGLANSTMLAGAGLASVSGVAVADASALSATLVPPLARVYGLGFASAVVAAAANLGPIIPPSAAMIVYAFMAGSSVSVGGLFMAGVVPGLILTVALIATTTVIVWLRGYEEADEEPLSAPGVMRQLLRSTPILLMPVVVIGGIVAGVFTATEGAAVAVVMALLIGFFVTRRLRISDLPHCLLNAATTTAVVGALIAFASTLTFLLTIDLLPMQLAALVESITTDPLMFLILVAIMLFFVGMFIESNAAYIMLVPLFHPIAVSYGIDPIYFGFLFVFNLIIGMLTPPVGVVLVVICGVTNIRMSELIRHVWPYVVVMYALLATCIAFPPLVTALPHALGY